MCNDRYKNIKQITYLSLLFFVSTHAIFVHTMEQANHLPIVLVSGISAPENGMQPMIDLIKKHIPGVYVRHIVIGFGRISSAENMYTQGEELAKKIRDDLILTNGFNLVTHSQGGLVGRYFIERYNSPPVHNCIALGSPHRGVDGIPSDIDENHPWIKEAEKYASKLLYTKTFQEWISFAEYWNDSCHHEEYLEYCSFLPYLNNEKEHEFFNLYKENICKLHNMVLVQSTKEYIVEPAISCHFGFYKQNSMTETESLFESDIYTNDTLGLKILHESGRLHLRDAHCLHTEFQSDVPNFMDNVLPFLLLSAQEEFVMQDKEKVEIYHQQIQ